MITVGFSTTTKFLSRIIRAITRAPCSHAWFSYSTQILGAARPMDMVAQAEWFGYETRPRWRWNQQNILVAEFELVGPDACDAVHYMLEKYLGSKYDYRAAALTGLWRLLGRSVRSRFRDPVKLMCSEGVIRTLALVSYKCALGLDPETTSPAQLMSRCFQHPEELKLIQALPDVHTKYGRQ